jgi:hypothetical protein
VPFAWARRLPGLAVRRPGNASVPPDGRSKRRAGPRRTVRRRWSRRSAVFPVRCWLGGRAAFRNTSLRLFSVFNAPVTVLPSNQSVGGREL